MTTLTANEIIAMKACLNYKKRECQLEDNFSNAGAAEFREELGWSKHQVAGLISSLEKKGMGYIDSDECALFWLSDEGVNAIFDVIDQEKAQQLAS